MYSSNGRTTIEGRSPAQHTVPAAAYQYRRKRKTRRHRLPKNTLHILYSTSTWRLELELAVHWMLLRHLTREQTTIKCYSDHEHGKESSVAIACTGSFIPAGRDPLCEASLIPGPLQKNSGCLAGCDLQDVVRTGCKLQLQCRPSCDSRQAAGWQ